MISRSNTGNIFENNVKYNTTNIKEIKRRFYVDSDGNVINKVASGTSAIKETIAGSKGQRKSQYYRIISINKTNYLAHRIAWVLYYGVWPNKGIDHINGNGLDNRKDNLRLAEHSENMKNCKHNSNNTSGYMGVTWNKKNHKWQAQISVNRKCVYLGSFSDLREAVKARKAANIKYDFHVNHGRISK